MDHECICAREEEGDDFTTEQWNDVDDVIQSIGRRVGAGPGDRIHPPGSKPPLSVTDQNILDLIKKNENNKLRGSKII